MDSYEAYIKELRDYLDEKRQAKKSFREIRCPYDPSLLIEGLPIKIGPRANPRAIILQEDTHIELGNPRSGSCAMLLWTNNLSLVNDSQISLVGPEIDEAANKSLPFAQILLIGGRGLEEKDHLELERMQFVSDQIEGYMIRSVPRKMWCRVSKSAAQKGFSLEILGRALIYLYKAKMPQIEAMEVIFITSSKDDVLGLEKLATQARKTKWERKKLKLREDGLYECDDLTCETCDEKPVCDEIRDLIVVRKQAKEIRQTV